MRPSSPAPPSQPGPQPGAVIRCAGNAYTLGRKIGTGYFGAVFECRDAWDNGLAAKVLIPRDRNFAALRNSWLQELDSLKRHRHPNITYVYDAFECDGYFYLVMERCTHTLVDVLALQGDKTAWLLPVARCILQAVSYMHSKGYVHKDLHPGNVFVSVDPGEFPGSAPGAVFFKVGDLGISRLESDINIFNTMLAAWMLPPEFLDTRQFGAVGKHVDIYHAALTLLSLLVGRGHAFSREQILAGYPRQLAQSLPSPYASAIARALRRHVHARTQSAMEFYAELRAAAPP